MQYRISIVFECVSSYRTTNFLYFYRSCTKTIFFFSNFIEFIKNRNSSRIKSKIGSEKVAIFDVKKNKSKKL